MAAGAAAAIVLAAEALAVVAMAEEEVAPVGAVAVAVPGIAKPMANVPDAMNDQAIRCHTFECR